MNESGKNKGKRLKLYALLAVTIAAIGVFAFLSSRWASNSSVKKVTVQGNTFIPENEITDRFEVSSYPETQIAEIQEKTLEHPFVDEACVTHNRVEQINVEIKEKTPVAIMISSTGDPVYVDSKGSVLPYRIYDKFKDIPVLRNIYTDGNIDFAAFLRMRELLEALNGIQTKDIKALVSEIIYDKKTNEFQLITSDSGVPVLLGFGSEIVANVKKLASYLRYKNKREYEKKLKYIDLRWRDQVVTA